MKDELLTTADYYDDESIFFTLLTISVNVVSSSFRVRLMVRFRAHLVFVSGHVIIFSVAISTLLSFITGAAPGKLIPQY